MKLFYTRGACSLVVRIMLNEMAVAFTDEAVDLRAKTTASGEDYWAINSKGAVPAIMLDNGEVITENQVILQYLADTHGKHVFLAPPGDLKRYRVLEWLNYISTELHKSLGSMFNPAMAEDNKTNVVIPMVMARFKYIDKHLQNHPYLGGKEFGLPDAYLFVMVRWAHFFKLDLSPFASLQAYIQTLNDRASVKLSLKQEGL